MGSANPASKSSESEEEFRAVFVRRSLAKRKKLCPKCFSEMDVISSLGGWMTPEEYGCPSCGYTGPVGLEPLEEE